MKQFAQITGKPSLPPYWAFGYHICRDVTNLTEFYEVHTLMVDGNYPYDSDCISSKIFANESHYFNSELFQLAEVRQARVMLSDEGRKVIAFHAPHVLARTGADNPGFDQGLALNVFLRDSAADPQNSVYIGETPAVTSVLA